MVDVIILVVEVCLFWLYWVVLGSDEPSLFEIIAYSIAVELLKIRSFRDSSSGDTLIGRGGIEIQDNSTLDEVCVVSPFAVTKDCQVPDFKVLSIPEMKNNIVNLQNQPKKNTIPIVHSEAVYCFCQALNLKVRLAPVENREVLSPEKRLTKNKITPIVHSKIVYSMCLALDLKAELAP
ncbi:hypothetical protein NPIL_437451 [Nephila pilipes]|uniref:Uncharacterized protein n=1 Tax=Nephila pilipes TaxID=299642 RepID=A0A8X6PFF9_NEPPI|nr:hypothetical protein NPIL_437451 [Nephila pilipes]